MNHRRILIALLMLMTMCTTAWGASVLPDEPAPPVDHRTPLVLIHGLCADRTTWTHDAGFAGFARTAPELARQFKLYHFDTAPADECRDEAFSPADVRAMAERLLDALSDAGIAADREIAIVAHSSGGLVARSFLQELRQTPRTRVLVTLATPHHGIDGVTADSALGRDGHDGDATAVNAWLACLNGLGHADACEGGGAAPRRAAFQRLITIGLVSPTTLGTARADDGVVPIASALLAGAGRDVRARYLGLGGQDAGSACTSDPSAHLAITHEDCLVQEDGAAPIAVFEAVAAALIGRDPEDERPGTKQANFELDFRPDLVVTGMSTLGSVIVAPGKTFPIIVTVKNQGLSSAGASTTRFYLSTDQTKSANDKLLTGVASIPALAVDTSFTKSVTVTVPSNTSLSYYFLIACADAAGAVTEVIETNNCLSTTGAPINVTRPDLWVRTVGAPPDVAAPGSAFAIAIEVQNDGPITSAPSKTRYYLSLDPMKNAGDKILAAVDSVPALAFGQIYPYVAQLTVPTSTVDGEYYVLACADATSANVEEDESNNCRNSDTRVLVGRPDLIILGLGDLPPVATVGLPLGMTFSVINGGSAPAPASVARFYLSDDTTKSTGDRLLTGSVAVDPIVPGGVKTPTGWAPPLIPANTPVGTYYLIVCTDAADDISEESETNNCGTSFTTVNVTKPDLVVSAVSTPFTTAARGTVIQVTDTTLNQGLGQAPATTTRYYLSLDQTKNVGDKQLSGSRAIPALNGGASSMSTVDVTVPSNTVLGVYWLLACADTATAASELNESNNCAASSTQITVTP